MNRLPHDLPKAVLFDHDGVLAASEPVHREAWKMLLLELNLPYDELQIQAMVGKPAPQIISRILDTFHPRRDPLQFDPDRLAQRKNDLFLELKPKLGAYPGVKEGLIWLKEKGIRTAVVSNAKRRELIAGLDHIELSHLLDLILSRDDVPAAKPDRLAYLFGAAQLGFIPEDCLAVEDSPVGIESAFMGGIPAAAILTSFSREIMANPVPGRPDLRPAWIGESMEEFFHWLRSF